MNRYAGKVFAILWKDVLSELRTKEIITSVFVFSLLVVVIFNFALDIEDETVLKVAPGILWVAFTFAGVLSLNRTFAMEKEKGCLEAMMLCPVSWDTIYWGKMAGSFLFMLFVEAIITPIFLILFDLPLFMPRLGLIIVLATLGFVSVGTLFSALAVNTKAKDIMLPLLFLPVVVPVIIAAVKASGLILDDKPWGDMSSWLQLLIAFDVVFLVISALVFEFVIEE